MKTRLVQVANAAVSLALLSQTAGCSFIFVDTPPSDPPRHSGVTSRVAPAECTTSKLAPGFDTAFGALQLVRTGMAAAASDNVYNDPNQPLSREADIALGISFATLFISSAIYGFVSTSRCSRLQRGDDYDQPSAPEPRETWGASTQETRPARKPTPPVEPAPAPSEDGQTPSEPTADPLPDPEETPSHFESPQ